MEDISTQILAADTMLDKGVPLPVRAPLFLRVFGKKTITLKLKQPFLGTNVRGAKLYLKAQQNAGNAKTLTEALKLREKTAKYIARAVAVYVLRGRIMSWLFNRPLGYLLMENVEEKTLSNIMAVMVTSGIEDFMTTIRLTHQLNLMKPNLSPMEKRS